MNPELKFTDVAAQPYAPQKRRDDLESFEYTFRAEITSIYPLTEMETLYRIQIVDPEERRRFTFTPGQFLMLEMPGIGEAPFSISSSPSIHGEVELCIRKVGNLTNFLPRVKRGTHVGIRGPFGTGFPVEEMHGQSVLLIAGGLGLVPLRSPIEYVMENRSHFRDVNIIYGTKTPAQLLFTYQYEIWRKDDIDLEIIVEKQDKSWKGPSGLITDPLEDILSGRDDEYYHNTYAIVCGPPVMFKFVCNMLNEFHIPMQKMFVSLERRMHCGMGKCCRCNVGSTYTCLTGPVFDYWTVMNLKEAI
ncbi:MAG TPA: oxidoreductase [Nitrospirae bacterium]|nr:anaerobic sulfite reductase subunit B [bacterium BMS3Abin06]HDH11387.1 oxidoreductase [Nitrospirota bacterium]HDZ01459.1 oxidoreductase [Nitrospirota bacterium]